jgi:hypothetical protein
VRKTSLKQLRDLALTQITEAERYKTEVKTYGVATLATFHQKNYEGHVAGNAEAPKTKLETKSSTR